MMAHLDHLSEVGPPAQAEASGAIGGTASTPVGAVLSALFHLTCIVFLLTFGTMRDKADATVSVEIVRLAPPPQPQPERQAETPTPQPAPVARKTASPRPSKPLAPAVPAVPAKEAPAPVMTGAPPEPAIEPTAAPHPEVQSIAPAQTRQADMTDYQLMIRARVMRFSPARVPFAGTVKVSFALDTEGRLLSAEITQGSGSGFLDRAALDAVERAAPFPPPPAGSDSGQRTFVIPFHFR